MQNQLSPQVRKDQNFLLFDKTYEQNSMDGNNIPIGFLDKLS